MVYKQEQYKKKNGKFNENNDGDTESWTRNRLFFNTTLPAHCRSVDFR